MSEFVDKTVLITGASRGIGRQLALDFGGDRANVCVNYAHSDVEAQRVVSEIESSGGKAILCKADIADSKQVNDMVDAAIKAFGRIDILVNNAGLNIDAAFLDMREEDWDRVYEVNIKGPFLVSQSVANQMMNGDGGIIINLSATTAIQGRVNASNYCSSKAGLNMLTKCMALELGPKIRVNGIGLGFIDSPLVGELFTEEQLTQVVDSTPMGRLTSIVETATFIKLLASKSTSFVTGQTIMFDGGRNMR